MTKIDFAQINGVAVTAFVFCLVAGGRAQRNPASACADNRGRIARPLPAVRTQSDTAQADATLPFAAVVDMIDVCHSTGVKVAVVAPVR